MPFSVLAGITVLGSQQSHFPLAFYSMTRNSNLSIKPQFSFNNQLNKIEDQYSAFVPCTQSETKQK